MDSSSTSQSTPALTRAPVYVAQRDLPGYVGPTPMVIIDSSAPDYAMWGRNCQVMCFSESEAASAFASYVDDNSAISADDVDAFWHGFHNLNVTR